MSSQKSRLSKIRDWNRKRKGKNEQKKRIIAEIRSKKSMVEKREELVQEPVSEEIDDLVSESMVEKREELVQEPVSEEIDDLVSESMVEKREELVQEPVSEEIDDLVSESMVEKREELVQEPVSEEIDDLVSESMVEKREELVQEPVSEEIDDLVSESMVEKTEESKNQRKSTIRSVFNKRRQKKRKKENRPEPEWMKIFTLVITLVAMLLGLSIMPLFPQPLPAVLAFLIAFVTLKKPILGMPIGGLLIGLGLMYNLAKLNFIVMLGEPTIRWIVVFVFLFLFTSLPVVFRDRKSAIVINLGIIAAFTLFSNQTFFLAIPLIVSSIVLFKKISFLSVIYYVLLTVPLQIMQYLKYVAQIARFDWWIEAGSSPPLYVPLTQVFADVQDSMLQFRLYDTSKVVFAISEQLSSDPPIMEHTVMEMLSHYIDSLPGIILFIVMIVGIVSALVLFIRTTFSQTNLGEANKILPIIAGTSATIAFFVLANSLQEPLAFRVDLNASAMALGTFATLIFTIPTFFMDQAPKERATVDMIDKKCKTLLQKILVFEEDLKTAKIAIPISFSSLETRSIILRDKLEDINSKNSRNLLVPSEIDEVLKELNNIEQTIDTLEPELHDILSEYQIFSNCEVSKWKGQFENIGIKIKNNNIIPFERYTTLEKRLESIKAIIKNSRTITEEIIEVTDQIYNGLFLLFDPTLPKNSQSILFARKQLKENFIPWNALKTLYVSLINMKKNYEHQISNSIENLNYSLKVLNTFSEKNEKLSKALGEDYNALIDLTQKVETTSINVDKDNFSILCVITIKQVFDSCVAITQKIFSLLFENLRMKEKNVESLMPPEGFMWGKNLEIKEKMISTIKMLKNTTKLKSSIVLEQLPSLLSIAEDGMETVIAYNEKEGLLLNYPIAEIVVEEKLKKNKQVTAKDLPFDPKYSLEYLKLFHSKRYNESNFDKTNNTLTSKK